MNMPELAKVMDSDFGVMDFMTITKEDLIAKGHIRPIGARHYATRAQLMQNMLGVFNSPVGQMIAPHISAKKLANMVEEYMGFEKYGFMKDNALLFEQAEMEKIKLQIQRDLQEAQATPSMEEQRLAQQLGE
jgi:hypothetical protein